MQVCHQPMCYLILGPGGPVFAQWGVCPDVYTVCSQCHRGTRLGGLQGQMKGLNPLLEFKGSFERRNGNEKSCSHFRAFIQHFPIFLMFRMFKDAKMTGEMLVYFCTVKTQGPVSLRKKNAQYKVRKQTKTKLTVNSNYFYYHIVILLLYSKILFSTKNVCLPVSSVLFCFCFSPVIDFAPQ